MDVLFEEAKGSMMAVGAAALIGSSVDQLFPSFTPADGTAPTFLRIALEAAAQLLLESALIGGYASWARRNGGLPMTTSHVVLFTMTFLVSQGNLTTKLAYLFAQARMLVRTGLFGGLGSLGQGIGSVSPSAAGGSAMTAGLSVATLPHEEDTSMDRSSTNGNDYTF